MAVPDGFDMQSARELSHDLRGPLAPLSVGLEILKLRLPKEDTSQETIAMMERQIQRLTAILDRLSVPVPGHTQGWSRP